MKTTSYVRTQNSIEYIAVKVAARACKTDSHLLPEEYFGVSIGRPFQIKRYLSL